MKKNIFTYIVARRAASFWSDEYFWIVKRSVSDASGYQMSDTEKERLALLALLEPGEEMEGVGYRGHVPDYFYVTPDNRLKPSA